MKPGDLVVYTTGLVKVHSPVLGMIISLHSKYTAQSGLNYYTVLLIDGRILQICDRYLEVVHGPS